MNSFDQSMNGGLHSSIKRFPGHGLLTLPPPLPEHHKVYMASTSEAKNIVNYEALFVYY